ncbi:MAG: DNA polymerase III subunit delta [Candidatus Cloacimonas sp.]|nr:DNA polymerase III subunit delta [Candidatus Cloacimonadota bacterium]
MSSREKAVNGQAFITGFNRHKLETFYYVFGPDYYIKERVVTLILNRAIKKEERDFDLTTFYGDDVDAITLLDSFLAHPFVAERKVIVVRKFDGMKADEQQRIIDAADENRNSNVLILMADTLDNRKKSAKQINQSAYVIQCRSPYKGEDMLPWLNAEVAATGKSIDRQAALLFVQNTELDYQTAANELEKLLLYSDDMSRITTKEVQASIRSSKSSSVFDLVDSVGNRDLKKSLTIAEKLIDSKEAAIMTITMLLRLFVQLWWINTLKREGVSTSEIMSKHMSDVFYSVRSDYLRYANNYPMRRLVPAFSILLEADADFKSINLDDKLLIERMIFRIIKVR